MFIKNDVTYVFSRVAFWVFLLTLISTLFAWYILPHVCEVRFDYVYFTDAVVCNDSSLSSLVHAYLYFVANLIVVSLLYIFMGVGALYALLSGQIIIFV